MRRACIVSAFALATLSLPAYGGEASLTAPPGRADVSRVVAGRYQVDTPHTHVVFAVTHMGYNSYLGIIGGATGTLEIDPANLRAAKVTIEAPLKGLFTTTEALTKTLSGLDFFDVARYPVATFRSTAVTVQGTRARIAGDLTIRGVTKPAVLDVRFIGAGPNPMALDFRTMKEATFETIGFEATTVIKRSDYGMVRGLPLLADQVRLNISVAFEKR